MTDPDREPVGPSTPALKRAISGELPQVFILGDVLGAGIHALVGEVAGEVGGAAVFAERAFHLPLVSFLVGVARSPPA